VFTSEEIVGVQIVIESADPGIWRFFNNDSDPVGAVYVTWLDEALLEVHGFNLEQDLSN
jgi:hypothetical protein